MTYETLTPELSSEQIADNEVGLLHASVIEIAYAETTAAALQALLRRVCEKTGWNVGQAWVPEHEGPALRRRALWVADGKRTLEKFAGLSASLKFLPGEGLPGRVWLSKVPTWVVDVTKDKNFPRSAQAQKAGIKTALAVPILADLEPVAVLEFFLRERREEDERMTILIATVAAQLGWTIRHKLAQDALRASEARYRMLIDKAPVCIHEIDEERRLKAVNPAGLRMLGGVDSSQVCGVSALNIVSADDQRRINRLLDRAFAGEFSEFEFIAAVPGAERRTFLSCFIPLTDEDGIVRKVLGTSQDISHFKQAEEKFLQAQKLEAVGRLAGGVAHDFNNVLNVIMGYAYLLQGGLTPERVRESASEILRAAERASALTKQMLAFSRKQVSQSPTSDLNAVISGITNMLRRLIGENVELHIQLASDVAYVAAEAGQIEQVIMNLVVNAHDAMAQGGQLRVATSDANLDEQRAHSLGVPPGQYGVLTVSDTGCGMDPKTKARIFEPFFTTKEPGKGTGLGLSTVHAIVTQSGGRVTVETAVGVGTTFSVYLPATERREPAIKLQPVVHTATTASETVLLVEDEESLRKLTQELLRAQGYPVLEAANGTSALEIASAQRGDIHLLITDMVMPGMSGRELARQIQMQRPQIKVIYTTGYADPDSAAEDDSISVLRKPFTPEALLHKIRDILASPDEVTPKADLGAVS